jgi:hypothetical protein
MNNRIMIMCTARKGVKDLPISAQGLPAIFLAGLPAVCLEGLPAVLFTRLWRVYPPCFWRNGGVADCPEFFGEEVIVARIKIWAAN